MTELVDKDINMALKYVSYVQEGKEKHWHVKERDIQQKPEWPWLGS